MGSVIGADTAREVVCILEDEGEDDKSKSLSAPLAEGEELEAGSDGVDLLCGR
jgi:hypothetical protein